MTREERLVARTGFETKEARVTTKRTTFFHPEDTRIFRVTLKSMIGSLGMFLAAWFFLVILGAAYAYYIAFIVVLGAVWDGWLVWSRQQLPSARRVLVNASSTFVLLYGVWFLNYYLGAYGFLGFLFLILVLAGFTVFRQRALYMWWLRHIEKRFLGMTAEERRERNKRWRFEEHEKENE